MNLDLDKYDTVKLSDAGTEVELLAPGSGERLGAFIRVCGTDSTVYRKAQMRSQNRRLQILQKRNAQKMTAEELDQEAIDVLAQCTLGWRGLGKGKEEVQFSHEKARELYETYPWIRKQVEDAMSDMSLFFDKG